jgi:hypothetical protein
MIGGCYVNGDRKRKCLLYVAHDWDQWQSLANGAVNVQFLIKGRNFFSSIAAVSF